MLQSAAAIAFTPYTYLSTDDDQLGLNAHNAAEIGLAQINNPVKRFGPVQHCAVSALTQLWVCGHYQLAEKESVTKTVKILLQYASGSLTPEDVRLNGRTLALDRGYLCSNVISYLESVGGTYLGTHKRDARFPFTFTTKNSRDHQSKMVLEEYGARTQRWARSNAFSRSRLFKNQPHYALAYRDGVKGKVGLLATNIPDCSPGSFIYKRSSTSMKFTTKETLPHCIRDLEKSIKILTNEQGGQDWFILRLFRFTSSTSISIIRMSHTLLRPNISDIPSEYESSLCKVSADLR